MHYFCLMAKKKYNLRKTIRRGLKQGWTKQQVFDHLIETLEVEISNDYRWIKYIAKEISFTPPFRIRNRLRVGIIFLILFVIVSCFISLMQQFPMMKIYGIIEFPLWITIIWFLGTNFFNILNLFLLGPVLRWNRQALLLLGIINAFLFIRTVFIWKLNIGLMPFITLAQCVSRFFIFFLSFIIYRFVRDNYIIKQEENGIWKVIFT
ncbi:MAG: hypothetical protein BWX51_00400 [Bacteroidetes bacterium ADurb.Bin012]|nr:MAG: hypothetical protein BWX51_00400 [Bacteroidetes bacterium ADurb.Bin012]